MPHDCWFCKFNRAILVVGLLAMAGVLLAASVYNAFHGHWAAAGKELIGVIIPLGMIWVGLKVLRAIPIAFDKLWPDDDESQ